MIKRLRTVLLSLAIVTGIVITFALCWHSLEEIHYLKSFYPGRFTVEEAFYASAVELIKVIIISLPFFLVILVSLCLLSILRKRNQ
ncbi:MAG: hypothetical protein JSW15_01360 [Deltaproteobacteria bacterium]|jgi:hypothetical protein|nr:MAG: hypothetical protein JSW15_01360 [Deltaproteobacteria bacterium]